VAPLDRHAGTGPLQHRERSVPRLMPPVIVLLILWGALHDLSMGAGATRGRGAGPARAIVTASWVEAALRWVPRLSCRSAAAGAEVDNRPLGRPALFHYTHRDALRCVNHEAAVELGLPP